MMRTIESPEGRALRRLAVIILSVLFAIIAGAPARAGDPNVIIDTSPGPVQITSAFAIPLNNHVQWATCLSFINTSGKLAVAIQFKIKLLSAFDDSIWSGTGDRIGVFSSGVEIAGPQNVDEYNRGVQGGSLGGANQKIANCWRAYVVQGTPAKLAVGVSKVKFADGTTWSAPTQAPATTATATPASR